MKEVKSKRAFEFLLYTKNNYKTLEYRKYKEKHTNQNLYLYYNNLNKTKRKWQKQSNNLTKAIYKR